MKKYYLINLFFIFFIHTFAQKKYNTSIRIIEKTMYCGGAKPSKEELKKLALSKPVVNKVYYIKAGIENNLKDKIIAKVKTNEFGKITLKLKPGKYYVIEKDFVKKFIAPSNTTEIIYDTTCLQEKWKTPLLVFKIVDQDILGLEIQKNKPCFYNIPCTTYKGAMPMKARP